MKQAIVLSSIAALSQGAQIFDIGYSNGDEPAATCMRKRYGRGAGKAVTSCDIYGDDCPDKAGALCYPACPAEYDAVANYCWV